jgi:large subunit ribosomal protein L23
MRRPNHVVSLLWRPKLPPNEANFKVPLRFNKFDLRDYLWNVYGVEVTKVRSLVQQQPLKRRSPGSRSMYRPKPLKFMTVELAKPFQWPELPVDKEPWSNELWQQREKMVEQRTEDQMNQMKSRIPLISKRPLSPERKKLAELADKMRSGEVEWKNDVELDPKWDKILAQTQKMSIEPTR